MNAFGNHRIARYYRKRGAQPSRPRCESWLLVLRVSHLPPAFVPADRDGRTAVALRLGLMWRLWWCVGVYSNWWLSALNFHA